MPRRPLRWPAVAAAVLALLLAACSTGTTDGATQATPAGTGSSADPDAFPVTINHVFGSTTIPEAPTRVATVSWVNADVALALGVVPVGMARDEWGGNANGSTPWKDAALERLGAPIGSDAAPAQYSEADGINYTAIARTAPDVILAAYSGLTKPEYTKLSKIAPVVAYPEIAYGTSWQDSTEMIGEALGREEAAEALVDTTERTIDDEVAAYPQLGGKTFIYGNLEPASADGVNVYTEADNRPRFLDELGMKQAPVVEQNTEDDQAFFIPWSAERADELEADVFVTWVPDEKTVAQIEKDPLLGQIPAVRRGSWVADSDNTLTLSVSASSPLSLPWALDRFLPMLGAAAEKA
ncbi:iron-siderophore ABC transporter substrate-binding protein [Nocardioides panacis]|uniref:Iron-siderophore ABC transporter substrate-binding protein n=1 Tax=Nocardioides panacis TaxID=2849501 RepID=A0A975SW71_9ACTN|nr:iron-siderophore ABC transporter substrate-binding protein [Nocardioides panacis]QWZ07052.1 iron-siderophore ABC transporter substrate-binding protein [Nocardioides panacis]